MSENIYCSLLGEEPTKSHQSNNKRLPVLFGVLGVIAATCLVVYCGRSGLQSVQEVVLSQSEDINASGNIQYNGNLQSGSFYSGSLDTFDVEDNEVLICESTHFAGKCFRFFISPTDGTRTWDCKASSFNDRACSIQVGRNVRAKFCTNSDCQPSRANWEVFGPMTWYDLEYRNYALSLMQYSFYERDPEDHVLLCNDVDFGLGTTSVWSVGKYNLNDLYNLNVQDDLSSMYIPLGLSAHLFVDDYLTGDNIEYAGPLTIYKLDDKWHDKISSFNIKNITITGLAGHWAFYTKQITSAEYQSTYKVTKTESQSSTFTESYQIAISQSFGATFMGTDSTTEISTTMGWENTFTQAMEYSVEEQFHFKCPSKEGQYQIAVYIWMMDAYRNDGEFANGSRTTVYVCRYDELADLPPDCAYNLCASDQCQTCKDDQP